MTASNFPINHRHAAPHGKAIAKSVPQAPVVLSSVEASIERTALLKQLRNFPHPGVVLIEAPAGSGKTQLLTQWCAKLRVSGTTVAWLNCRASDDPASALIIDLLRALAVAGVEDLPQAPEHALDEGRLALFLHELKRSLSAHAQAILLVLDDFHRVQDPTTHGLIGGLLKDPAANVSIAIASRRRCNIPVADVLMHGRMLLMDRESLFFSMAEAKALLGASVAPAILQSVLKLTRGWPAALKTARACLGQWTSTTTDLSHVPRFARLMGDYCEQEVMVYVRRAAAELLVATSICEEIEPGLCDAIRGADDSGQLIGELVAHETILQQTSVADCWRLPGLLHDLILARTKSECSRDLATWHRNAARYLLPRGALQPAVNHFVAAGDEQSAAAALQEANPFYIVASQGDKYVEALLRLIPDEVTYQYPQLAVCRAYLDEKKGLFDSARHRLATVVARTSSTVDDAGGNHAQLKRCLLAFEQGVEIHNRTRVSKDFIRSLEERKSELKLDPKLAVFYYVTIGMLYQLRGDLDTAEAHYNECAKLHEAERAPWIDVWLRYHYGAVALARGRLMDARHWLRSGLRIWRAQFGGYVAYEAWAKILLAEADYESGDLEQARRKLSEASFTAENIEGRFEHHAALCEITALMHHHAGRGDEIDVTLARVQSLPRIGKLLAEFLPVLRFRMSVLQGQDDSAREILAASKLDVRWHDENSCDPFGHREWDLLGLALATFEIRAGQLEAAGAILERLRLVSSRAGRLRTATHARVLSAVVRHRLGLTEDAIELLVRALETGRAEGYQMLFMEEADLTREVLMAVVAAPGSASKKNVASFASTLLDKMSARAQQAERAVTDLLSAREREVIGELCLGSSNKVIARKLGLSVPTVKFHLQNLFRKLEARNRATVIAEAHRRGLIS